MTKTWRWACVISMLAGGCVSEYEGRDPSVIASEDRGTWVPNKADGEVSCEDACGGKSAGGCWCDEACVRWGDCCPDVLDMCGIDNEGPQGDHHEDDEEEEPAPIPPNAVCFPGADNSGNTCLPTVSVGTPSGYTYPSPLNGSSKYRKPVRYIDLQAVDPNTQIAPNFKLSEIAQAWKGRYAVVQPHAIKRLQAMRNSSGALKINSGYRSPSYNKSVGGAKWSRHMYGDGFDIAPVNISVNSLEPKCAQNGGTLVEYRTHVHCDWRTQGLDPMLFGQAAHGADPIAELGWADYDGRIVPDGDGFVTELVGFDEGEPVQRWFAMDADGEILAEGEGERFVPPREATVIQVDVGRAIELELELDPARPLSRLDQAQ